MSILLKGARRASASNSAGSLLLDTMGVTATSAVGLRKLRSEYSGACLRVRRSDNAEQDIGFSGNDLDTATLTSFIGANDGFVVTLYDQSTNGTRHATQSTASKQPKIVAAGVLMTQNGRPAIRYANASGVETWLGGYKFAAPSTAWSASLIAMSDSVSGSHRVFGIDGYGFNVNGLYIENAGNGQVNFGRSGANTQINAGSTAVSANVYQVYVVTHSAANAVAAYRNGETGGTNGAVTWTNGALSSFDIGAYRGSGGTFNQAPALAGYFAEMISFAAVLNSTQIDTLRNDQRTYYGAP